jgi:nicotinamide mononucleotide transporter
MFELSAIVGAVTSYFAGPWGLLELAATIFSATCVYLAVRHNQWTWFFGAIGVVLFGILFFHYTLYSDAGLQILFYLPMQLVGYLMWRKAAQSTENDQYVRSLKSSHLLMIVAAAVAMAGLNGYLMLTFTTDVSFPYLDALIVWLSISAQLLMNAKFRESWAFWIGVDVIAIYVYFAKGLIVTSGLYVVFLILATMGAIAWYKQYAAQNKVA